MTTPKVMIVTNIPNPYRIPLLNELDGQLKEKGIKLLVVFGAKSIHRRKWEVEMADCEFEYLVLDSRKIELMDPEKTMMSYRGVLKTIRQESPNIIITLGFSLATQKIWVRSWFRKTRYVIWSGSLGNRGQQVPFIRYVQRKSLVKRAVGFIAYGTKAKQYLESLGADPELIHIAVNTVDTQYYQDQVQRLKEKSPSTGDTKHLLYVGYLSPRKNVVKLLSIIKSAAQIRSDFVLDIVGDGGDCPNLESYVNTHNLQDQVRFHGYKQRNEIPRFMARADCFLFQTDFDIWGLVLNEAMAAGLPCISSIHAGATHDLIIDGINGFAMDFNDEDKIKDKILWIFDNPEEAKAIGEHAREYVNQHATIPQSASGFIRLVEKLLA